LDLLRGELLVANGENFINTPTPASVTPAGINAATVSLTVIEPPKPSDWGPPGVSAHTAQVKTTITMAIPVNVSGVGAFTVNLPVTIEGGGADATLASIEPSDCANSTVTSAGVTAVARTLTATVGAFTATAANGVTISAAQGVPASTGGQSQNHDFTPAFDQVWTTTAAANLGSLSVPPATITVGGTAVPVPSDVVATTVADALNTRPSQLGSTVMPPLYPPQVMAYG